jgi:hypothetical protein
MSRVFLLSPASCAGNRARLLLSQSARFALAQQLRSGPGAELGEVFAFISQLYFRGKLAYARAFARTPDHEPCPLGDGVFVITTSRGPVSWRERVDLEALRAFAAVEMRAANISYTGALRRGAELIAGHLSRDDQVVLLGSIASDKYAAVLTQVFGGRLFFPREFVGRGDMSRGGLLLRCVRDGRELDYIPLAGAVRHGVRPPRLDRL